jgi:hypothetical protein
MRFDSFARADQLAERLTAARADHFHAVFTDEPVGIEVQPMK